MYCVYVHLCWEMYECGRGVYIEGGYTRVYILYTSAIAYMVAILYISYPAVIPPC